MANSYDARSIPIPSGSGLPPRPSFDYERPRSPEPRRPVIDPYKNGRYTSGRHSDPYHDYQRAPSPGVYERYRDVSVDITWNKTTTWYHPRNLKDSSSLVRNRPRGDSNGSNTSRTFEPSDSWKRDRERRNSKEHFTTRTSDRDKHFDKTSWSPSYQERSYSRDYRSPERLGRVSDPYRSSASHRSPLRSPRWRYHSRSRSRSQSRSHSRSPSRSASRSQSPVNRSRLLVRPETSAIGSSARTYRFQDGSLANKPIPTGPRRTTLPSSSKEIRRSRSSSQSSSIASSRESSAKPSVRPSDPIDGDTPMGANTSDLQDSKSSTTSQFPSRYSLGYASELLNVLRNSNVNEGQDSHSGAATNIPSVTEKTTVNSPLTETVTKTESLSEAMVVDAPASSTQLNASNVALHEPKPPSPPFDPIITTPRDPIAAPPSPNEAELIRPRDIPDYKVEDIPDMSSASTVRDAVRVVIMRRLLSDQQTRQERVDPVLFSNLSLLPKNDFEEKPVEENSIHALMTEIIHPESGRAKARSETYDQLENSLVEKFEKRQDNLKTKVEKLREDYISLHDRWKAHCAMLDRQAKAKSDARVVDVKGNSGSVVPPPMTGRTTRRSAASLGDAVRSDLEMEQIIASLGSNEATDPNQLCLRNVATIPDMISVIKGKVDYVYDDHNLRVEDPISYYAPQTGINDWTEEEKQIFTDKFAIFPKQFGAISRFLPNKTTAQCVDFYYLHKNVDIDFKKIVNAPGRRGRRRTAKRKTNALLADIRQHDAEVSSSGIATRAAASGRGRAKRVAAPTSVPLAVVPTPIIHLEPRKSVPRKMSFHLESTPTTATPTPEPESRPKRGRVTISRASVGASQIEQEEEVVSVPASEPEPEPETESRPTKKPRRNGRRVKSAAMVSDDVNEETASPPPLADPEIADAAYVARQKVNSEWSESERDLFLNLLSQHGFDALKIASGIPTKSASQCSDYYHANEVALGFRKILENLRKESESKEFPVNPGAPASKGFADTEKTVYDDISNPPATMPTNIPTFPNGPPYPDMAAFFAHSHFSRFTTGVSPYGAPSSPVPVFPGQVYYPAPPPVGSNTSGTTGLAPYPTNAATYAGRPYIPYPFSYQAGYPPMAMAAHPATAAGGTVPPSGVPTPYPPNAATAAAARPYFPGYN